MKKLADFLADRVHSALRLVGILGLLLGWGAMYFFDDWSSPFFWVLISVAVVLGYGGAWGGLAEQWGWKPLREDPLGWRKAKKSYKTDTQAEEEANTRDKP